uniref:Serpin domain-containing protein n=1 Tax=Panagrolaimus sp. ES5 TaxID=591445 RepID=A0AC34FBG4_9BILA
MDLSDDDDSDKELKELLEKMRQSEREKNPNPSPPPPPLPKELESEIKIATNLLKIIYKTAENESIVFSPSAISSALTSISKNVDEIAGKEIEMLIGKDINYDEKYFKDLLYSNNLFYSSDLTLLESQNCKGSTESDNCWKPIDYSDKIKAAEKINDIVSAETKILKLIKPSDFANKDNFPLFLGNAASFKAKFQEPFDGQKSATFFSNPPRTIDMIYTEAGVCWRYSSGKTWKCLGIPYKSPERWLYIILPNATDGLANLIQEFDYSMIKKCLYE